MRAKETTLEYCWALEAAVPDCLGVTHLVPFHWSPTLFNAFASSDSLFHVSQFKFFLIMKLSKAAIATLL